MMLVSISPYSLDKADWNAWWKYKINNTKFEVHKYVASTFAKLGQDLGLKNYYPTDIEDVADKIMNTSVSITLAPPIVI